MRHIMLCLLFALTITSAQAERIKDIAHVQGVRPNQLLGYGLVVGW
jgi:flagellar P-ring protein FlgI